MDTIIVMEIQFDPEKNVRNIELRGIDLQDAAQFEWESALIIQDTHVRITESLVTELSASLKTVSMPWFLPLAKGQLGL